MAREIDWERRLKQFEDYLKIFKAFLDPFSIDVSFPHPRTHLLYRRGVQSAANPVCFCLSNKHKEGVLAWLVWVWLPLQGFGSIRYGARSI
jgi:predicted nucleotide-binding protein (sugar kinase/HSP70/actin superfamily)